MLTSRKCKNKKLRHSEYYDMTKVTDNLYKDSINNKIFYNLMEIISSEQNIKLAYRNIKRNTGSNTAGVDGLKIKDLANKSQEDIIKGVRDRLNNYQPKATKRVMIPKPNGKERPLGIPCIWDRLVQQCLLQILEPICEAKFHKNSNGFRPNKSTENAIAQTMKIIQQSKMYYVVDIDIKGFFDNIDHCKLRKQIWTMGIRDKKLLQIITKMLKSTIQLPNGLRTKNEKGTPQGGILSPLLSNIVLNELDWWVASQWEDIPTKKEYKCYVHPTGTVNRAHKFAPLRKTNLKEIYFVRYADDFKIFCRTYESAMKTYYATVDFLNTRLKLEISPEKSKVTNLKNHKSEFLGFSIGTVVKGNKRVVSSDISPKNLQRIKHELKEKVNTMKNKKSEDVCRIINQYNAVVMGIHNYYCRATNVYCNFEPIQKYIHFRFYNTLKHNYRRKGKLPNGYIRQRYGKCLQVRYCYGKVIVPVGDVITKNAMHVKGIVNKYTEEGRKEIHKSLSNKIDMKILYRLMNTTSPNQSIEYTDNRISVYTAQLGKCAITGRKLEFDDIHCHHKNPKKLGGTDEYKNLTIVSNNIHKLIHATIDETINKILIIEKLNKVQLGKLNRLRSLVGNKEISIT